MNKENDLYKEKYELYDSLFTQDNIDGILKTVENFLNNPVFILDTSYRFISRSPLARDEISSTETHNEENYLLSDIVSLMKKDKCIDSIYKTTNSFFYYSDQSLIFCSIRINTLTIAYICVLQSKRKFEQEDLELTNILSNILSIQIQKEHLFISNSGLDEEYYLMDLLVNKIDNLEYAEKRLKHGNFSLDKNLLILSIPYKQKYEDYRHNFGLKQIIDGLKRILGNCISTYHKDMIIFLISNSHQQVISESIKSSLLEFLKLNNLKCGISFVFENLSYIKDYFYQSINTLQLSSHMKINENLNYFEDYVEYYLFHMANNITNDLHKINLSTLVHPWIKKLIKFDEENKGELFITLKTYLENNRNANNTSSKLNIHRSTFFYRLNKIQSLLDTSFDNGNNLLKLELSFKLLSYKLHNYGKLND